MKRPLYFLIILLIPFTFSCKHRAKEKNSFVPVFSTYKSDTTKSNDLAPKNEIFYGILTPVEICTIFNRLGIPYNNATLNPISNRDKYLTEPIKRVESDISEPDTILFLMNDAYIKMEAHLREGGRESTAGLMIMGGWVEAMFIATQLVYDPDKPDPEVIQRIAQQK